MPICNSTSSCPGRRLVVHMFEDVAATIHARAVICHYQPFLDCQRSTARGREAAIGRLLPHVEGRSRPDIDSPSRFHRYWWDWQLAASQGGTCTRGLRISRPKRLDVYRFSFESTGALASDNEYSGFAVASAHYIAFAERKHACPYRVIYHLRRFAWHLYRTNNSRLSSALTGPIPNMTSAC